MVESSNISTGGLYFSTEAPLDIGSRVEVFLALPVKIRGAGFAAAAMRGARGPRSAGQDSADERR